jgi:cytosine/adenosine deaminase-related metal-dependent hydrolase
MKTETLLLRGRTLVTDARQGAAGVVPDGAIAIQDGLVAAAGPFQQVRATHPDARVLGNGKQLLLPGLIDAHCHGRGPSPIQKGVPTDFLENALFDWAVMPVLPPELNAGICALRHIRSGATTLHINSTDDEGPAALERARRNIAAYLGTGIRLAFSASIRDLNKLALQDEAFWRTLPADLQAWSKPMVFVDRAKLHDDYFALHEALRGEFDGPETKILLSATWAHGATEDYLRRLKARSDQLGGVPIHIHTLQTPVQKAYGIRAHGKGTVPWLDEIGFLGPHTVFGHAIHVTQDDIARMAARGTSITHHASCNLHMRNGIAPVTAYLRAGVSVAMGMDDKTINDDEDAVMEMRMIHKLHRLATYDLEAPALDAYTALQIATTNAARACGFDGVTGALAPGMKADAILVDLDRIAEDPWLDPRLDIVEALVQRGLGSDVATVVSGGKVLMEDRQVRTIDVDALYREVCGFLAKGIGPEQRATADMLRRLKPLVQAWYRGWHEGVVDAPFYPVNSRT